MEWMYHDTHPKYKEGYMDMMKMMIQEMETWCGHEPLKMKNFSFSKGESWKQMEMLDMDMKTDVVDGRNCQMVAARG